MFKKKDSSLLQLNQFKKQRTKIIRDWEKEEYKHSVIINDMIKKYNKPIEKETKVKNLEKPRLMNLVKNGIEGNSENYKIKNEEKLSKVSQKDINSLKKAAHINYNDISKNIKEEKENSLNSVTLFMIALLPSCVGFIVFVSFIILCAMELVHRTHLNYRPITNNHMKKKSFIDI